MRFQFPPVDRWEAVRDSRPLFTQLRVGDVVIAAHAQERAIW